MSIIQSFYDNMAGQYDKLFLDWHATAREQAALLDKLFRDRGYGPGTQVLDCACGIGTQAIGLAALGYDVTASDISEGELEEAKQRAENNNVKLRLERADFCALSEVFPQQFDIIICMDNALPHMLSKDALRSAVNSIADRLAPGGIFVASIRDYDSLLDNKPPYSPPYIHKTEKGQRVSFQTWVWNGDNYQLTQYIIDDEEALQEATRCLQCINPRCMTGCPVSIEIPHFIKAIKEHNLEEAYQIIDDTELIFNEFGMDAEVFPSNMEEAKKLLMELKKSYDEEKRGIRISYLGDAFKLTTKKEQPMDYGTDFTSCQ